MMASLLRALIGAGIVMALLDQRMPAWLLEQAHGWTFELGGSGAMVTSTGLGEPFCS